jgi:hypothetical protein
LFGSNALGGSTLSRNAGLFCACSRDFVVRSCGSSFKFLRTNQGDSFSLYPCSNLLGFHTLSFRPLSFRLHLFCALGGLSIRNAPRFRLSFCSGLSSRLLC